MHEPRDSAGRAAPAARLPASPGEVDEAALRAYARALGAALRAPVIVAIHGELGAGKTTLVQEAARGAGVADDVTSPTFALVHEYDASGVPVYHLDIYRLSGPDDLTNIGWDEIVGGDAIVFIEWPERAGWRLPSPRVDITIHPVEGRTGHRRVEVTWPD